MVKTSPTPVRTASDVASRSIPEPSMSGWRSGRARMPNSFSAGAPIVLDTETGGQASSLMLGRRAGDRELVGLRGGDQTSFGIKERCGGSVSPGDGGEGGDGVAAALAAGEPAVAGVAEDRDGKRQDQHDRAERVERRAAVAAV